MDNEARPRKLFNAMNISDIEEGSSANEEASNPSNQEALDEFHADE